MSATPVNSASSFETLLLHGGKFSDVLGSCAVPVYNSAAFGFNSSDHGAQVASLTQFGNIYSRFTNPTVSVLQNRVAMLEGGIAACAVASGSAAVMVTVLALAQAGDNIISSVNVHGGTYHLFKALAKQIGVECRFIKTYHPDDYVAAIDGRTKFIFFESISNPQYAVPDFEALAKVAHEKGLPLICDNTFGCAGYFCRPIDYGVDIVIHSATKWIGGHGTTVGGVIVDGGTFNWGIHGNRFRQFHDKQTRLWEKFGRRAFAVRCQWEVLRDVGCTLSASAAQQLLIGLESLSVRCERHAENTRMLSDWLCTQPQVAWVSYLGHKSHAYHENAKRYLRRGFGSVISFGAKGGKQASLQVCDALKMVITTGNLGDSKTLVVHPWSTTHEQFDEKEREAVGVTDDLIRLSVGIEHIDDIKKDFSQALAQLANPKDSNLGPSTAQLLVQSAINRGLYGEEPYALSN